VVRLVSQPMNYLSHTGGAQQSSLSGSTAQTTGAPSSPVEVIRGEVRIGKELNAGQEVLKEWFYTCYIIGTAGFISLHLAAWGILQYYWNQPKENTQCNWEQQPYGDPSFDFDRDHDDDGFESLDGGNGIHHRQDVDDAFSNGDNRTGSDDMAGDSENPDDWEECAPDASGAQDSELEADNLNGPSRERSTNFSARQGVGTMNHRERQRSPALPHRRAASPRHSGIARQPLFATRMSDPQQSLRFVPQLRTKGEAEGRRNGRQKERQPRLSTVPAKGVAHEKPVSGSVDDTDEEIFLDCLADLDANLSTSAKLVTAFKSDADNMANALNSCPIPVSAELTTSATGSADESNGKGHGVKPSVLPRADSRSMLKPSLSVVEMESAIYEESLCGAVLKVPEAQVLDSFLADLINPFVR
jgi:hypothetical protein